MAANQDAAQEKLWQDNYDARQRYFEDHLGPFPPDILKMMNMTGVWPGGGLYVIEAKKLQGAPVVYTTFGLSNPDMPTTVRLVQGELTSEGGRPTQMQGTLQRRDPAPQTPGAAGYGYEILMLTPAREDWALGFLQWAVGAEINHDAGMVARIEKYHGLTVEEIGVGDGLAINVLIHKAQAPLPNGAQLPGGKMDVLVATTITPEEMAWSIENGRDALLGKLISSGVGQVSVLERESVI